MGKSSQVRHSNTVVIQSMDHEIYVHQDYWIGLEPFTIFWLS
jgi:hypothetical protein